MNIYVSTAYKCNGLLIGLDLVKFNSLDDVEFEFIHKKNFYKMFDRFDGCSKDFTVTQDGRVTLDFPTVRTIVLDNQDFLVEKEEIKVRKKILSLYDLLRTLASLDCLYLGVPESLDSFEGKTIPSFRRLRVSSSTMNILISVYDKDLGWKSKNLVSVNDNGTLRQEEFYCAVPINLEKDISRFNLQRIKDVCIEGKDYCIVRYTKNLPISNSVADDYVFCEPLVCHLVARSRLYKGIILGLNYLEKQFNSYTDSSVKPATTFNREVNRSGVFLKSKSKNVRADEVANHISNLIKLLKSSRTAGLSIDRSNIKMYVDHFKLDQIWFPILEVILGCIDLDDNLDLATITLENTVLAQSEYNLLLLNIDLFLYNERVNCIINPKSLILRGLFVDFDIVGGMYKNIVSVRRVK